MMDSLSDVELNKISGGSIAVYLAYKIYRVIKIKLLMDRVFID